MEVSAVSSLSSATSAATGMLPDSAQVRMDFMSLFIAQVRNQNPMEPLSNEAMMTQLAQLSTLEEMQVMSENMAAVALGQQITQASSLIGTQVTFQGDGELLTGLVTGVLLDEGMPTLEVEGSYPLALSDVLRIETPVSE